MSTDAQFRSKAAWTWADQISTYRFWGLLAFYALSNTASAVLVGSLFLAATDVGLSRTTVTSVLGALSIWGLFGFWVAWAASRWKSKAMLLFFVLAQLFGIVCFFLGLRLTSVVWLYFGALFFAVGSGAVLLSVPAIMAGGMGGAETFVLTFGIVVVVSKLAYPLVNVGFFASFFDRASGVPGDQSFAAPIAGLIVAGLIFLMPVNRAFFSEAPPSRGRSFAPKHRHPAGVALLMFVPFYNIYHLLHWLYRAHGEVAFLSPSRVLLSPRGAAWAGALVPFLIPVLLAILVDQLNQRKSEQASRRRHATWAVFLWGMFLGPVGMGVVQSAINQSQSES